jgi:NAD(P)-dependent dehydrogenase (short-subunit alcohol dehydrogenase family)
MSELAGKVAIVTGAGRNIGRAIALALADAGASVLVNARSNRAEADAVAREIEALGRQALVHIGNVADAANVQAMADAAVKKFGRIDILVNNAALRREKPFAEMDHAEWREIMDVTLDGAFHCVKACLPALCQSGAGTIVNIGGLSAHTGAKGRAHVVTAKAGIIGFTRAFRASHHQRRARQAGRCRRSRAIPVQPGGALHQRAGDSYQWRGLSGLLTPRFAWRVCTGMPDKCPRLPGHLMVPIGA